MQNTKNINKRLHKNLLNVVNRSISVNNTAQYEELKTKLHKHNIRTVTMGFPDMYGRFMGKKFDSEYFLSVNIINNVRKYLKEVLLLVTTYFQLTWFVLLYQTQDWLLIKGVLATL